MIARRLEDNIWSDETHPPFDGKCSTASDLGSIPAELLDKLRVEFYSDPSQAVFKAIAEA